MAGAAGARSGGGGGGGGGVGGGEGGGEPCLAPGVGEPALRREEHPPRLRPAPRARVAHTLVRVVPDQPARGGVERARLDERAVGPERQGGDRLGGGRCPPP